MFFNGGIIITFNSFPSECRNSQVFAHSDFKMTLSFAIIGSIAATTLKIFQTNCKISNFFTFKDKIPSFLRSGIVYKFQCGSCNATYYGKTKRHFKVRMCEHLGISALTGKRVKGDDDSAIKEHLLFCSHTPEFEDFSILASNNNDFKVTLMESLLINRDHPPLNKNKQSLPLELFDS